MDTSYFTSRFTWNPSDEHVYAASEFEDSSDNGSISGSSSCLSNRHDELVEYNYNRATLMVAKAFKLWSIYFVIDFDYGWL